MTMRVAILGAALALGAFAPTVASAAIPCSDIPKAQGFVDRLRPGPNTREAQRHLQAAKHARSPRRCSIELARVDHYARRSAAADRRLDRERR
jgi:hypothetical protein